MTLMCITKYRGDVSITKLFCIADQSFFDCLVPSQNHHFTGSKVHPKYRPILFR